MTVKLSFQSSSRLLRTAPEIRKQSQYSSLTTALAEMGLAAADPIYSGDIGKSISRRSISL
jgi:hypothetical protein